MPAGIVPAVSRRAVAGVSSKASLLVAGAAVLGAARFPLETRAGKAGKKARKRCKQQKGECLAGIEAFCIANIPVDLQGCIATFASCCNSLTRCDARSSTECLMQTVFDESTG